MPDSMVTATNIFNQSRLFLGAYRTVMHPLCEESGLPQAALDILLFLANNPEHTTARDICRYRNMKPAIISFHVDRLVSDQYLERSSVPDDRRKFRLKCTQKAEPIIRQGRVLQARFAAQLTSGLTEQELQQFRHVLCHFEENLHRIQLGGDTNEPV